MPDLKPTVDDVANALGKPVLKMEPLAVENGGRHSRIYEIHSEHEDYVLRIPKGQQGYHTKYVQNRIPLTNWFDQQWATEATGKTGIPAPKIVYSNRSAPEPQRIVIMRKLPGIHISDYEEWNGCPYDEREFGTILSKMHAITPSGYGPIDDFGNAYFNTWGEFLTAMVEGMLKRCARRQSLSKEVTRALTDICLPALSALQMDKPALLHIESLGFANLLYDQDTRKITAFLDFEDCIGGDPLYELEWMCYYYGPRKSHQPYFKYERFEEPYGIWPEDPQRSLLYSVLTYLEKLTWIPPDCERARNHNQKIIECVNQL